MSYDCRALALGLRSMDRHVFPLAFNLRIRHGFDGASRSSCNFQIGIGRSQSHDFYSNFKLAFPITQRPRLLLALQLHHTCGPYATYTNTNFFSVSCCSYHYNTLRFIPHILHKGQSGRHVCVHSTMYDANLICGCSRIHFAHSNYSKVQIRR